MTIALQFYLIVLVTCCEAISVTSDDTDVSNELNQQQMLGNLRKKDL